MQNNIKYECSKTMQIANFCLNVMQQNNTKETLENISDQGQASKHQEAGS